MRAYSICCRAQKLNMFLCIHQVTPHVEVVDSAIQIRYRNATRGPVGPVYNIRFFCPCPVEEGFNNLLIYYLRQVNEVNGGYIVFVRCVSLCLSVCLSVCMCVRSGPVNQTSLKWTLNANSSKTVKDTDFTFDTRVPRDSPDKTLNLF